MAARARRLRLGRRALLTSAGVSGLLLGCGASPQTRSVTPGRASTEAADPAGAARRIRYGNEHGSQFADLRMPTGAPLATVVLLHGGYWLPQYGLDLMEPLATRFTTLGFATWNVEYRRTGAGGGVPATLLDVAAGIDRLAGPGLPRGLTGKVVLVGHSAGGQLAAWAASRTEATPGGPAAFGLRGAVSLSGVLDLTRAAGESGSRAPVTAFAGGTPAEVPGQYALADPTLLAPASCPIFATHADDDTVVPADQGTSYVAAARAAGGRAENIRVPGDHFTLIDPGYASFPTISRLVTAASR